MFLKIDYGSYNKFKTQALSSIPEMEEERMIKWDSLFGNSRARLEVWEGEGVWTVQREVTIKVR